jgi:hypothetical protein
VLDYLVAQTRRHQPAAIEHHLAAIADAHEEVGRSSPTADDRVQVALTQVRRRDRKGGAPAGSRAARDLGTMLEAAPGGLVGARDRALLLVSHGARLRPSELAVLDVSDFVVVRAGLAVSRMRGRVVISTGSSDDMSAARAWEDWVAAAGLTGGPAFRAIDRRDRVGLTRLGERAITRILRRAAERAGLDPSRSVTGG